MSSKKRGKSASEAPSSQKRRKEIYQDDADSSSPFAWTPSGVQVLLPGAQRLIFLGKGTLTVHSGEVKVAGRVLSAGSAPVELSADPSSALLISVEATECRIPLAGSGGAAFSIAGGIPEKRGFQVFLEGDADSPGVFEIPQAWHQAAAGIAQSIEAGQAAGAPPAVIAVCGPKKVGKSSFARYLANVLLNTNNSLAYLDTDCGQPEFTPPGLVSLSVLNSPIIGPPHLHQRQPDASHFVGDTSPSTDPARYLTSITNLYEWYCKNCTTGNNKSTTAPPLIVNAHGWVKGFGFDLLVDTLRMLPTTHFVHIMSPNPRRNLPLGIFWAEEEGVRRTHVPPPLMFDLPAVGGHVQTHGGGGDGGSGANGLPIGAMPGGTPGAGRSTPTPTQAPAAVEQRALHWVSFTQRCVETAAFESGKKKKGNDTNEVPTEEKEKEEEEDVGDQLAGACPYEILLSDLNIDILYSSVPPSQLGYALNGAIVGLCGKPEAPNTPAPCLGLGLIRAVDGSAQKAFLLTPLSLNELEKVERMEVGRLELPPALLQTGRFQSPYLALHSLSTAGTGAGAIKSRNNLLRSGQM